MRIALARAFVLPIACAVGALFAGPAQAKEPPAPGGAAAPAESAPIPLHQAVQRGLLTVQGLRPDSYRSITLELVNPRDTALDVDLCGSYLTPRGTKPCQRLGLGPVITPGSQPPRRPGAVVVSLAPRGTWSARVATVCLDASKSCPSDQAFGPATDPLPPVRERVMRWWADHPEAPQHDVNGAIWRNAPEVELTPGSTLTTTHRTPPRVRGALRGSTAYLLRDGALLARDPDGVERFLATQIEDVFPLEGVLYAVARVGSARELWRYVETGEELWKRVVAVPDDLEILTLEALPGGGLLATSASKLLRLAPGETEIRPLFVLPKDATDLSYSLLPRGRVRVGFTLPASRGVFQGGEQHHERGARPELWLVHLAGGRPAEKLKTFWNVAGIAQGRSGAFALTNAGHLRELVGESFRDQAGPDGLERILHVGAEHLWACTRTGALVSVRLATGAFVEAGVSCPGLTELRFDGVSADAIAVSGGALVRVNATTGKIGTLEAAPPAAPPTVEEVPETPAR